MPSIKGYNVTVVDKDGDPVAVSSSGKLETETTLDLSGTTIDATIDDVGITPPSGMGSGSKLATSSAQTLASSTAIKKVDIMSDSDNGANIYIGGSTITSNGAGGGVLLYPGDFYSVDIDNLVEIYIVSAGADSTIAYNYYT